jgi:hypothetical protein
VVIERRLDNEDLILEALRLDPDIYQAAKWAHLLQYLVEHDEMSFPINSVDDFERLFDHAGEVDFYGDTSLPRPRPELFPPLVFPIEDIYQFLQISLALIRFEHAVPFHGAVGKD